MEIARGRSAHAPSGPAGDTFVGTVVKDPVMAAEGVVVNMIAFEPGSRTFWHRHENGQLLHVVAGAGAVCTRGEEPRPLRAGDVVWVPPGEIHWHGGAADTMMIHLAVSLGATQWLEEVAEAHPAWDALHE